MKAMTIEQQVTHRLLAPLLVVLLSLFLCINVSAAGDLDDDWGLPLAGGPAPGDEPTPPGAGTGTGGDSTETELLNLDVRVGAETILGVLEERLGQLVLDRAGHAGTTAVPVEATAAEVEPLSTAATLSVIELGDGISFQADVRVDRLEGTGSLRAKLVAPQEALVQQAYLVLDGLGPQAGVEGLLDSLQSGLSGVTGLVPLGAVPWVDLNEVQLGLDAYGAQLDGTHVSIVMASVDGLGELHITAARMAIDEGDMQVVVR
jgi:hypothetical protein